MLYSEDKATAAFAPAVLALVTVVLKSALEWRFGGEIAAGTH